LSALGLGRIVGGTSVRDLYEGRNTLRVDGISQTGETRDETIIIQTDMRLVARTQGICTDAFFAGDKSYATLCQCFVKTNQTIANRSIGFHINELLCRFDNAILEHDMFKLDWLKQFVILFCHFVKFL